MKRGFTLVELMITISIIAILSAVVVLVINPLELSRRGNDANRLADLSNLRQAIDSAVQDATVSGVSVLCKGVTPPCRGSSQENSRNTDGSGWVKIDLQLQKSASLPVLPIDPVNSDTYHYSYCSDGNTWEMSMVLESEFQKNKMQADGGIDPNRYEVGTNLNLMAPGGVCSY